MARKAVFELEEKQEDQHSGQVKWTPVKEVVGTIFPKTSTLHVEGQQEHETVKHEIRMSWHPDLFKGQAERRLVHEDGRLFYVEGVLDFHESHKEFRVMTTVRDG